MTETEQPKLNLITGEGPFIHSGVTTDRLALPLIISLIPLLLRETLAKGEVFALHCLFAMIGAWVVDAALRALQKKAFKIDLQAILYGLVVACFVPFQSPWWLAFVGGAGTILFGKVLFGRLGIFPLNPILLSAGIISTISWLLTSNLNVGLTTWLHHHGSFPVDDADPIVLLSALVPLGLIVVRRYMAAKATTTTALIWLVVGMVLALLPRQSFPSEIFSPLPALLLSILALSLDTMSLPVTRSGRIMFGILVTIGLVIGLVVFPNGKVVLDASISGASGYETFGPTFFIVLPPLVSNLLSPLIDRFTQPRRFGS